MRSSRSELTFLLSLVAFIHCRKDEPARRTPPSDRVDGSAQVDGAASVEAPRTGVPRTLVTLASGLERPKDLAVDRKDVYFTVYATGVVLAVPRHGGGIRTIASGQEDPWGIAVDDAAVFWANRGWHHPIMRAPLAGGTPTVLAANEHYATAITFDVENVYFVTSSAVRGVPKAGGPAFTIADGQRAPSDVTVTPTRVVWTNYNDGSVMAKPFHGQAGALTLAAQDPQPSAVAASDAVVFWTSLGGGHVRRCPIEGGASADIAPANFPSAIALDGAFVYWAEKGAGRLVKAPREGGASVVLATDQAGPRAIAVDEDSVYWVNEGSGRDGSIVRLTPK